MDIDFKLFIHFSLILVSGIFAIQLFSYKYNLSKSSRILGFFMFCLMLYLLSTIPILTRQYKISVYTQFLIQPLMLIIYPLYYLYIKSLTTPNFSFNKKSIRLFIPSIIFFLFNAILFFLIKQEDKLLFVSGILNSFFTLSLPLRIYIILYFIGFVIYYIQIIVFIFSAIKLLKSHKKNIDELYSYEKRISLKWINIVITITIVNSVIEIIIVLSFFAYYFYILETLYYSLLMLHTSFLGYFGLKQNDIYVVPQNLSQHPTATQYIDIGPLHLTKEHEKTHEELEQLAQRIDEIVENNKLYTKHELNIYDLAHLLNTNKTYISQAINKIHNTSFRNYINEFRLKEAMKYLTQKEYEHLSIDGIAELAGFASRSTFINAFKNKYNISPSEFRKQHKTT